MKIPCPSCGGEVVFQRTLSIFAVCPYCASTLLRSDINVEVVGKMATLSDDWSPIQVGTMGRIGPVSFTVAGRVTLRWERGTWNEWFLYSDDQNHGWLSEAQGFYCVSFPADFPPSAPQDQALLKTGTSFQIGDGQYTIKDIKQAQCIGSQGELPFCGAVGRKSISVDCTGADGLFACLDYSGDGCLAFVGKFYNFADLHFSGLRELDGWER